MSELPVQKKTVNNTYRSDKLKNIICCNCGKSGHVYKKCFNPITSLGIICFLTKDCKPLDVKTKNKWSTTNEPPLETSHDIKYLLIRRKDSLCFAEFVRVKFNTSDKESIKKILENITEEEFKFLQEVKTPDEIWNRLWTSKKKSRTRMNEYNRVKKKLKILINGSLDKDKNPFTLKSILDEIKPGRLTPEWGFPKGRRVPRESDIHCSVREFCEETDINKNDIKVLTNISPVEETFTGSNGVIYKHIYYVAQLQRNITPCINPSNIHQKAEIGDIQFFSKGDAIEKLEKENTERINIFTKVSNFLETLLSSSNEIENGNKKE